jgi:hypothetical protein
MADQRELARPGAPARTLQGALGELALIALALACYLLVRDYTDDATASAARHARDLLALERAVGLDGEHAVQDATLAVPGLDVVVTQFYVWGYFPVVLGVLGWLFVRHRAHYGRYRDALLASGAGGLLVYAFYPCAPPWIGGVGYTDTVPAHSLESVARPEVITNHLGAMPSFHVGWLALAAWAAWPVLRSRRARALAVVWPALMAYAVVATGNHWVLDAPAGLALAGVGVLATRVAWWRPRRAP